MLVERSFRPKCLGVCIIFQSGSSSRGGSSLKCAIKSSSSSSAWSIIAPTASCIVTFLPSLINSWAIKRSSFFFLQSSIFIVSVIV